MNEVHDHHRNLTYQQTIDRDKKRFDMADKDKSKELDKDEFADFLHPRESHSNQTSHGAGSMFVHYDRMVCVYVL